ncbi:flagellar assembly protein H [Rubripirellula amarantea]|uniref:Flagellar assembly protein FliH n=1 Tax=Rubripirellula amarantea TaxID=2527999 RepID=A0A5C5WQ34_9BACT|nr:FliH/SctL family protein [Rubripirellula amarantea]TWT52994.1 flagellar assembly protein H [Rubripirellula amarantea]
MASVLKSTNTSQHNTDATREVSGLAGFNLDDLANEGRLRLKQCQSQVEDLLQKAREDAAILRAEATTQGYQDGLKKAEVDADAKLKAEAKKQAADSLKMVQKAVAEMHRNYEAWMNSYVESLHTIALAAAEKVCRHQLANEASLMVNWATEAVHSARSASRLSIAVHPEMLVQIGEQLDELLASPDLPEQSQVVPDASLAVSEIAVRQTGGEIKAGLNAQLQRLEELLS